MTERTYSTTPQNATPTQSGFHTVANNHARDALPHTESVEEEPYTIKCICDYSDDDGNTIFCEKCDTWQHIECFYHGNVVEASREDFNHLCADCDSRSERELDKRKATERQRQQRHDRPVHDSSEKKTKRPPSKSHKKKPKPSDLQTNGYNHDLDAGHSVKAGSPLEHSSHGKKTKTHRSHHSTSSQATKRSPSHASRINTHGHPLSPATTPPDLPDNFRIHSYSDQLQVLYENDPSHQQIDSNTFAGLTVGNTISQWLRDQDQLRSDTGIETKEDVFNFVKAGIGLDSQARPALEVIDEPVAGHPSLHLRSLIVIDALDKDDVLIGELNGMVGFQRDYSNEDPLRYQKLCHPAPFVFFHPQLPLYIDTRHEGSICRYIRRSCRANSCLETYITNQTEYHFCVSNDRRLAAREKVTLAWDFRFPAATKARYLYLLGLSDEEGTHQSDISDNEYQELTELIHNALSDYGGCACGLGPECAFARFHRNHFGKSQIHATATKSKKGRKPKQHISPNGTGHATNSRDVSEGRQEMFDAEDDSRSASGSTRSKPHSRDMTPTANGFGDTSTEMITEREKRKLANYEKTFEKMDQEQPPRKKKRNSDGPVSAPITSGATVKNKQKVSISSVSNSMNGSNNRQYKDAGTSRQQSGSPTMAQSPSDATPPYSRHPSRQSSVPIRSRQESVALKSNYSNASTQTDDVENAWFSSYPSSRRKKKFVSLSQRILRTHQAAQAEREARRKSQMAYMMNGIETHSISHASSPEMHEGVLRPLGPSQHPMQDGTERPRSVDSSAASTDGILTTTDVVMIDAPSNSVSGKPTPPSWPGVFLPQTNPKSPTESRSSELRVQMPPIPSFSNNASHGIPLTPGAGTPSSVGGSIPQSPYGSAFPPSFSSSVLNNVVQHPSPIKKKLSLQDYRAIKASAGNRNSIDSNSTIPTLNSSASISEESKGPGVLEGSAVVDSPASENVDPIAASGEALHELSPAQGTV